MESKKLTTKAPADVIAEIDALNLESVKMRLMDQELGQGWTSEYANSIEAAYKTYLKMITKYQDYAEQIMLAKDVDEFWHTHILQTMKYADDCEKVFGAFLHHNPHVGARTPEDAAKRTAQTEATRRLYEGEFGTSEAAESAWRGEWSTTRAAYSNAALKNEPAYSNAALRTGDAAYSNAAVAKEAAYSNAAIGSQHAAYSNAAVTVGDAAYSNADLRAREVAYSNAAISVREAAYSNAAIRAQTAAYSNAAIGAASAAYSNAAITSGKSTHSKDTVAASAH
jgi:hypothetical protein